MRRRNWKKTRLLARHLRPAASALLLGMGASLLLTLLRMAFTQVIRFTVDGVLLVGHAALADTMKDIMIDAAGALTATVIGSLAIRHDRKWMYPKLYE